MKMTGQLVHARPIVGRNETEIVFDAYGQHAADMESLSGKPLDIEIKVHREKRSIKANNLCWELCSQIGRAITPPIPKEEVYRQAIKDVGVFIQICLRKNDYPTFDRQWQGRGTGWFTEITDTHDVLDAVDVMAYCGSSTYDTKAMSTLIDYLVDQAQQMELQIAYDLREIEKIKEDWRSIAEGV